MTRITKYRPLSPWSAFPGDLERFFDRAFPALLEEENGTTESNVWAPRMDFSETDTEYMMSMDLPGVDKKHVNVQVDNHQLMVTGERKEERKEGKRDFHRIERKYGRFYRALALPQNAMAENAKADFKDGVLTVTVPKAEVSKPRRVEVR